MIEIINDDMRNMKEYIDDNSIDCIVTDPPYELNFMNKGWDNAGVSFSKETWEKCFDALKPGGYLLAFGGSRTYHRIACAIEDAGFEIRDTIMWLYGSGFPKSMNISKGIEGKLTIGSVNTKDFAKLNGEKLDSGNWGIAKLQKEQGYRDKNYDVESINAKRLGKLEPTTELAKQYEGWETCLKPAFEPIIVARKPFKGSLVDNVIENGVGGLNIDECRVVNTGGVKKVNIEKNSQSKNCGFGCNGKLEDLNNGRFPANVILTYDDTDYEEVCDGFPITGNESASRYFYCAKASKKDRDEGLDEFENVKGGTLKFRQDGSLDGQIPVRKNIHPTVKPTDLMQYLVRLVAPKGATILDPFTGSGSTGKAVAYENKERNANYKFIGFELNKEYCEIAEARIKYVKDTKERNPNIFDFIEE